MEARLILQFTFQQLNGQIFDEYKIVTYLPHHTNISDTASQ
jgi:hypothetical protein